MFQMMGNIASALALKELSDALGVLDAPFSELPDVKNKDGESIQDVKEKRLALVRQHVKNAGDIINLDETVKLKAQMGVQAALVSKFKDTIKKALKESGAPQQVLDALDNPALLPPGFGGGEECDCPACNPPEKKDEGNEFGFGGIVKRIREREAQQPK